MVLSAIRWSSREPSCGTVKISKLLSKVLVHVLRSLFPVFAGILQNAAGIFSFLSCVSEPRSDHHLYANLPGDVTSPAM